jgi:hypothetical protein
LSCVIGGMIDRTRIRWNGIGVWVEPPLVLDSRLRSIQHYHARRENK